MIRILSLQFQRHRCHPPASMIRHTSGVPSELGENLALPRLAAPTYCAEPRLHFSTRAPSSRLLSWLSMISATASQSLLPCRLSRNLLHDTRKGAVTYSK